MTIHTNRLSFVSAVTTCILRLLWQFVSPCFFFGNNQGRLVREIKFVSINVISFTEDIILTVGLWIGALDRAGSGGASKSIEFIFTTISVTLENRLLQMAL